MDTLSTDTTKIERGHYKVDRSDGETFEVKRRGDEWYVTHNDVAFSLTYGETKKTCMFDIRNDFLRWS